MKTARHGREDGRDQGGVCFLLSKKKKLLRNLNKGKENLTLKRINTRTQNHWCSDSRLSPSPDSGDGKGTAEANKPFCQNKETQKPYQQD